MPCSNMWPTRAKKLLTVHIQTLDVDMEFSVPVCGVFSLVSRYVVCLV